MSRKMVGENDDLRKFAIKHESLKQDYYEIKQETEAMKKHLEMVKSKKERLLAEVRFLRKRYKLLTGVSFGSQKGEVASQVKCKSPVLARPIPQYTMAPPKLPSFAPPLLQTNNMNKIYPNKSIRPSFDQDFLNRRESAPSLSLPAFPPPPLSGFPLPIAEQKPVERKEFQVFWEPLRAGSKYREESKVQEEIPMRMPYPMPECSNGVANDLKLSIFKDIPNGFVVPGRPGKRKMYWEDPMALKV